MLLALLLCLVPLCQGLSCALYDFSRAQPNCAAACSSPAVQVGNKCLMSWHYLIGEQVHSCSGAVSSDRMLCCRKGQFIQQSQCLPCNGQVYNNGQACCSSDSYLDYSTGSILCSRIATSNCPQIHFNSLFKVCCPPGQYYNVATNICTGPAGLNCNLEIGACCPNGQYLEWAGGEYICLSTCSWRSSQISNFQCEYKFCGSSGKALISSPSPAAGKLLSLASGCCYGLDGSGICLNADKSCLGGFANRGWSICCPSGQFYVVANGTCAQDCLGIILFNSLCLSLGQALDLRDISGRPREFSQDSQCNGISMSTGLPVCCPSGHYIADSLGCSYCNGNIFTLQGGQVCCPRDSIFDAVSGSCQPCDGVTDSSFTLCCPQGNYIRYDSGGVASCVSDCSLDNLYKTVACCEALTQGCSTSFSPTTCNPALLVSSACAGCPAFCSQNSQLCTSISSFSASTCNSSCMSNQILVSGVGCLDCDVSCLGCTTPMNNAGCLSCVAGYTQFGGSCQACALACLTCSQFTDSCTSCYPRDVQVGTRCMRSCLSSGLYLDSTTQACLSCSPLCYECSSSSSSSCTSCPVSQFLVQQPVGTCQACDIKCKTCFNSPSTCISCASNYYKSADGSCASYCPGAIYSAYVRGGLCLLCHPSCNTCKGHPMNCESCRNDSNFLDESWGVAICSPCVSPCDKCGGLTQCFSCVNGFFLFGSSCRKCDSTCATCNGPSNSNCLSCSGTSTLSDLGFCSGCSTQCSVCEGNHCTICKSGYFINNGICMNECPPATYPLATTCKACDPTCDACNSTTCLTCNSNYLYALGSKCYSLCPANYSPSGKICTPTAPPKPNPTPTPNPEPNPSSNNSVFNNSSSQMVQQKVVIRKGVAFVNLYFSTSQFETDNLSVSLINKLTGVAIPLQPSGPIDRSENRLYFSVAIPSDQDYSAYSLLQMSSTSKGTTSTLVSSQSSSQLLLESLSDNAFKNMKVMGYIFSPIILLMALLTKAKGHFTAEQANNIILHSLNFAQVCYLFKYASPLDEAAYFFLNGFGISHISFFPNFFSLLIPSFYVETPVEKTLVPDGNLLRNAGFIFSYQIVVMGLFAIGVIASLCIWKARNSNEPPFMRRVTRIGILLFHIGFMGELFSAFVQLIQPHSSQEQYASFTSANVGCSYMILLLIPLLMAGIIYHFYATYNSDVLEHYYTLREAGLYLLIYAQALVMCLAVGKPLMGLFLLALEAVWFIFNYQLYRYGQGVQLVGYRKYFGISGFICLAYLFLSLQHYVPWILLTISVSLTIIVLLFYCGYQLVGIYYYNIFPSDKEDPDA